ncbi:MAG TPA: nucleoside triphosphate pyrophosphohydrolase [Chitinophagaceae bacterium]|nr:nucleoside triphosphate pyrophosphohydrolase [Chitinophagaceae bacterium]
MDATTQAFQRLITIMDELREKCPWDRKQTIDTLRSMTIEETYELADAITDKDWKGIREELGDLLLHIVFYAKIGQEQTQFSLEEVITGICEKLISRHPHIYGDVEVKDEEDVKKNWEKLKLKEGKTSVLSGVPKGLPSMVKAMRLQEKARQVGFEWDTRDQVWDKVKEEMEELTEAVQNRDTINSDENNIKVEEELGDVFFSLVNYARFLQIDAEQALERTNRKFTSRFREMEAIAMQQGKDLQQMTLAEMDELWNTIKRPKV